MDVPEITAPPEVEKTVEYAWLFDVDGVITHPEQKKVTDPQIFYEIIKRLQAGEPVALVTGRSLSWMIERVVVPLEQRINDRSLLANFFGLGEKGGVWLSYDENGQRRETIDQNISVPQFLQDEVRKIIEDQFTDTMFFDDSKRTMISTEMRDDVTLNQYHPPQEKLDQILEDLLAEHNLTNQFKVDPTTIATDIENKHVGKDYGAQKVLDWLGQRGIKPKNFITFGDSHSDIPLAQKIHENGLPVQFVFVGRPEHVDVNKLPFPVIFTQNRYEKGTLEYLISTQ